MNVAIVAVTEIAVAVAAIVILSWLHRRYQQHRDD